MVVAAIGCFAIVSYGISYDGWQPVWSMLDILLFLGAALGGLLGVLSVPNLNRQFPGFSKNAAWAGAVIFAVALFLLVPLWVWKSWL